MKLTCVTVVFNAVKAGNGEALMRCARSAAQLKVPHEHIFVDGASTDGTLGVLRELQSEIPPLKVISEPDTGIYNALNKGLRDAQGEWFYVLGCDDYIIYPEVLDEIVASVEDDVDVIVTPVVTDTDGRRGFRPIEDYRMFCGTPYNHQGVLVRTEVMREFGGFDERYRICADYDLTLKLHLANRRIKFVDRSFACYAHGGLSDRCVAERCKESCQVAGERLGLGVWAKSFRARRGFPPFPSVFAYLFHANSSIRKAARYVWRRWCAYCGICIYDATVTRALRWIGRGRRFLFGRSRMD